MIGKENLQPKLFEDIFNNVLAQAIQHNLVSGKVIFTDSSHIKANANKNKYTTIEVNVTLREYLAELEEEVSKVRTNHSKDELKKKIILLKPKRLNKVKLILKVGTCLDVGYFTAQNHE